MDPKTTNLLNSLFMVGQNSIVIVSGANMLLSESDVMEAETVIKGCKVLLCQLEIANNTTLAALKLARKHNGKSYSNL